MSDTDKDSFRLELDGHVYLISKGSDGKELKTALNADLCLRALVVLLDDALKNKTLNTFLSLGKSAEK